MTLQQLKYVVETAKCSSMNEASRRLFMSQPSLSNSIAELEKELGISIFTRSSKGIIITQDGADFLNYAAQIVEQTEAVKSRYLNRDNDKIRFSVSTQHYAFSVSSFIRLVNELGEDKYRFSIRETRTSEIIDNVRDLRSEIGVIYMDDVNETFLQKYLSENHLCFCELFRAKPHIFISKTHPLASKEMVEFNELDPYPYLSFVQGDSDSAHFAEEIVPSWIQNKQINVTDRATLFNLLIGLNGYTVSSGVLSGDLNRDNITAVPLNSETVMKIGYIYRENSVRSTIANRYIELLKDSVNKT